jgi:7-cyano-7-deazaguanine synthase
MKVVVILSGGMDSTTCLYYALSKGYEVVSCIGYEYGSKHNFRELAVAKKTCQKLNVPFSVVRLDFGLFESNLLKTGAEIPNGHYEDPVMKKTVVPFRNGIMLSYSAGIAESLKADGIMLGNHAGDHAVYPDCRQHFIEPMSQAIRKGTYSEIELLSPFCNKTKADIAKIGHNLGVDWLLTYSCYKGGDSHCGVCATCVERREAFQLAGVQDLTHYA